MRDGRRPGKGGPPPARPGVGAALGVAGSLLLHGALVLYVGLSVSTPDLDLEFQLPSEVEFGLTEGMTATTGPPGGATEPPPTEPAATEPAEPPSEEGLSAADAGARAGPDAGPPEPDDAGVPADGGHDAGPERERVASAAEDEGQPEASDGTGVGGEGEGTVELPPGAQIAMRIDMARIRRSPLATDVRALLGEIPDWQMVLDGSGIEPLDDLERVLIASPNLQRSRMLLAGRYEGEAGRVREIVQRMAAARGVPASWRTEHGVPVAPWPDADETERVIAIVGPHHFTITRPEDLPRLLAVARVRAEQEDDDGEDDEGAEPAEAEPTGADALLSMPEGSALTLEVEGVRQFVRAPRGVPTRVRLVVNERPAGGAELMAEGTYESERLAAEAREFWEHARASYAGHIVVQLTGMSSALADMELVVEGDRLTARTALNARQLRLALDYVQGVLREQARRRERALQRQQAAPPATTSPPAPPSPARD